MSWVRLDDVFPECKKLLARPDANLRVEASVALVLTALHVRAICYCSRNLTDGLLPAGAVPGILVGTEGEGWPERMVEAGLWEVREGYAARMGSASFRGFFVHDYLDYNPSKRERKKFIQQRREAAKSRWKKEKRSPDPPCGDGYGNDAARMAPASDPDPRKIKIKTFPSIFSPPTADGRKAGRNNPSSRVGEPRVPTEDEVPVSRRGGATAGTSPPPCPECAFVVNLLNELAGRRFHVEPSTVRNLHARHRDHGVEACCRVVRVKVLDWLGTEWEKYLDPTTLFRPTKFQKYLNEPPRKAPPERKLDRLSAADADEIRRRRLDAERISPERRSAFLIYLHREITVSVDVLDSEQHGGTSPDFDRASVRLEELRDEVAYLEAGKED